MSTHFGCAPVLQLFPMTQDSVFPLTTCSFDSVGSLSVAPFSNTEARFDWTHFWMIRTGIFSGSFGENFLGGNGGSEQTGAFVVGGSLCDGPETHESSSSSSSRNGFFGGLSLCFSDVPLNLDEPFVLDVSLILDIPLAHLTIESFSILTYEKLHSIIIHSITY